jgi:hypothetical protein
MNGRSNGLCLIVHFSNWDIYGWFAFPVEPSTFLLFLEENTYA